MQHQDQDDQDGSLHQPGRGRGGGGGGLGPGADQRHLQHGGALGEQSLDAVDADLLDQLHLEAVGQLVLAGQRQGDVAVSPGHRHPHRLHVVTEGRGGSLNFDIDTQYSEKMPINTFSLSKAPTNPCCLLLFFKTLF